MAAAAGKQYELLFRLSAALGSNFNSTFKQALNTQKQLSDSTKRLNDTQKKIDGYQKATKSISDQQTKLEKLKAEHEEISQKIQKHQQTAEMLRAKIAETGDASGELTAALAKEESEIEKNTDKLKRNETQIRQTNGRIEEQQSKLDQLGEELREAGINTENLTEENERLKTSFEKLKNAQDRINQIGEKQAEVKQKIADTKSELLTTTAKVAAVGAAFIAGPVKGAMEFETAMQKVSTIADASQVPLDKLSSDVTRLSKETGISANLIAEDVYNAISAGQETKDAVGFVETSAKLAKAGFAESAQSLDILTTILNAYGMSADKATTVSDMLIQTQNKGKVTVGELSSVMGKIIPTAKSNNVALEQITAGYSIMTAKGIAAAETTTYMNSMLNELGKSGTTADKALRAAAGAGFKDLMKNGASLADILNILQNDAQKSGKSLSDVFGSAEAGKAAVTLLSDGVDGFNESVQGMIDSTNATQSAFEKVENTASARVEKAKNSIQLLANTVGQQFLPIVGEAAEKAMVLVNKVSDFAEKNPKVVKAVVMAAGALAGLKIASLGAKLGALELQNGVLSVLGGIEKLKVVGLTGFGKFGGVITGVGAKFIKFGGTVGGLVNKFTGIGNVIAAVTTKAAAIPGLLGGIGGKITTIFPLLGKLSGPLQMIGGIGGKIAGIAVAAGPIVGILIAIAGVMAVVATHSETARAKIAEIFGPEILTSLDAIWNAFSEIGSHIKSLMPTVTASMQPLIGVLINLVNTIMPALAAIIQVCVPIVNALASTFSGVLSAAINAAIGVLSGLTTALQGIINFITGVFTGNWRQAWEGVKQIFSGIIEAIKSIFTGAMNTIKSVISGIGDAVSGVASKIKGLVTGGGGGGVPGHAKGSSDTEGAFIAGEKGPELITGQPHKVVYTADETKNLFAAQQAAKAAMEAKPQAEAIKPQEAPAPTVIPQQGGGTNNNVTVTQTNNITINGDKPDNLEAVLAKNNEALLEEVEKKLGGDNDERRTRYE